jgi:hypothetical protein
MAKDAYYFSHDGNARNDIKIVRLRRKMKMEGVGIYWCIIEMLRETKGHELPLSSIEDIAYDLDCEENALNQVLRDFDLFVITQTHFSSNRLTRSMIKYELTLEKRRHAGSLGGQASAKHLLTIAQADVQANVNDCSSIKGKERKGKENNNPLPPEGENIEDSINEWQVDFVWFWEAYGKKADRSKCEQKFKKLSKAERKIMRLHLPEYVASTPDVQYRKNPLRYLNGKCWNDEILKPRTQPGINGVVKMIY